MFNCARINLILMFCSVAGIAIIFVGLFVQSNCKFYIDDFQKDSTVSTWAEHSDTVMAEGKSKASFVLHETGYFRKAVLFTMLNPQPCGAALAGIKRNITLDIRKFKFISLKIKGQGQYRGYELFLKQKGSSVDDYPNYVHYFEAPLEYEIIHLPIRSFKAYWKGEQVEDAKPLDRSHITSMGIVAYGGAHMAKKQHGVAALEIEWIRLE
ncbi:uncharacterized protein LOC108917585 isoform X1 [Anoplophora glabripennis]|uniref:uncharacterized protein LOC108917585 isoform X1 n=1 Tax=Anoplophora glabripennis TaxID=217634 RepID=UPI000874F1EF|nr:uncharacterized protein LOC108917585 isoform X1 [Anoplophora glabripennis]